MTKREMRKRLEEEGGGGEGQKWEKQMERSEEKLNKFEGLRELEQVGLLDQEASECHWRLFLEKS